MLRITIYYLISLTIMAFYGGEVCPFIDSITLLAWTETLAVFFTLLFIIRHFVIRHYVESADVMQQPRRQMIAEFSLFIFAGIAIAIYNHFVYTFPPLSSGGKVTVGMFTLGSFLSIDMALQRERKVIRGARETGDRFAPIDQFRSLTKKFMVFSFLVLSFVAVVIMLVIGKDIYWISMAAPEEIPRAQVSISLEILFVMLVTLGLVLNLLYSYSMNLKDFFENETEVLTEVNRGNLDGFVPVLSTDEFAHIAHHTNEMIDGLREKRRIQNIFGKVMSPDVANHLLSLGEDEFRLGGQQRDLVIMLSDIRGFTTLTEKYDPEELVRGLNHYFSDMVAAIHSHQGVVDKFIGDGILAVFGLENPDQAPDRALAAALDMFQVCMSGDASYGIPIEMGIGMHCGVVIAGNIGSEERMEYTVIGDAVNIAARLESVTKDVNAPLVISDSLLKELNEQHRSMPWRDFGAQDLKGKREKIAAYGLMQQDILL